MEFPLQDNDIGGDDSATIASSTKRSFDDIEDNGDDDISGSKKARMELDEANGMISSLNESLQSCQDDLASCQNKFESAKTEIEKWKSAFEKESFIPARKIPEPKFVIDYIETLKASETSLKEQLEIAQMKLHIRDLKDELKQKSKQKKEEMVNKSDTNGDQEANSEGSTTAAAGNSRHQLDAAHCKDVDTPNEIADMKTQLARTEGLVSIIYTNLGLLLQSKGIDPALLPSMLANTRAEAATDVANPTPSAIQSDLPQPMQAEL